MQNKNPIIIYLFIFEDFIYEELFIIKYLFKK